MRGTNNLPKNIFLAQFKVAQNFHYFCKVRACRISIKNSIFLKFPETVEKHFFWWGEQIILQKNIFLALFKIAQNFHYFCKAGAFRIFDKNSIFQKLPKIVEKHLFLMRGTNNLPKNIFLAQFKIAQNFHCFFCKGRACWIFVKNSIF